MSSLRRTINFSCIAALLILSASTLLSQPLPASSDARLSTLEKKVESLDSLRDEGAGGCALGMLFGAFCALWAQNTGRNPWLWFFLALFFNIITVVVLLKKNSADLALRHRSGSPDTNV